MMKRVFILVIALSCGFAAGLVVTGGMRSDSEGVATDAPAPLASPPAAAPVLAAQPSAALAQPDFTRVAAQAVGSVTNISSTQFVRTSNSPFASDPFFQHFFQDDDIFGSRSRRETSLGSGVIVSADGYILTNHHVIGDNVHEVVVALADKREMSARIVGVDAYTDLALLKVSARGLPVVPWGDSSKLKVAEWVLAIGNPFQLNQTVTLGIISAVGRANVGISQYEDFIQTDAAINPGNSGGALISARGELIGINTAIYTQSGGYQGVGFAVPSNLARHVIDDLMKYGEVRRGDIGFIEVTGLTPQLAEELGASSLRGALVSRMRRDSAAYDAGMRPGDIVVSFNGTSVDDAGHFLRLLADAAIGSTARLTLVREGRQVNVSVPVTQSHARRR
jgi:Do/DeqQ family serine protease